MSEEDRPQPSKWQVLHERGLDLEDRDIDFIIEHIVAGTRDTLDYFEIKNSDWPKVIFSDNLDTPGYIPDQDALNIPLPYLKRVGKLGVALSGHQQMVYQLPNSEPLNIPYSHWLRLVGREETVHHLQKTGLSQLNARYPQQDPSSLSQLDRLMCDIEVEARNIVDKISVKLREKPTWQGLDDHLQKAYLDKYCQVPILVDS